MTELPPRLFSSDEEIDELGKAWLECRLAREAWTHEAHLAATTWLLLCRPEIDADAELGPIIRRFNASVGGVNDDTQGYHETVTRVFLHGVRLFLAEADRSRPLHRLVNGLLRSPMGGRDWPLRFYSRDLLFSVKARRGWVPPDLAPLPPQPCLTARAARARSGS